MVLNVGKQLFFVYASGNLTAVAKDALDRQSFNRPPVGPIVAAMKALEDTQDPAVRHLITSVMPLIEEAAQAELAARRQEMERGLSLFPTDRPVLIETYHGARSAQIVGTRPANPRKFGRFLAKLATNTSSSDPSSSSTHAYKRLNRVKKVVYFIRFSLLSQNKAGKHNTDRVFRPIVEKLLRLNC